MTYTPIELTKNGKTEVAETIAEEARLRWDGWLPTGTPVPVTAFDQRVRTLIEDADSETVAALRGAYESRGGGALTLQSALPNLFEAMRSYNDASPATLRFIGIGSSVGLGPDGALSVANAASARLFSKLSPVINPLGNLVLAHTNGSVGGTTMNSGNGTDYAAAKTAAAGAPSVLTMAYGMNDGQTVQYHASQTLPGMYTAGLSIINKAQADGSDVIIFTTPHPHTGRNPWDMGATTPTYSVSGGQPVPDDTAGASVKQVRNADGDLVPVSYRHWRVNQVLRKLAADTGSLLLDAEHYWLVAVAKYGEDALFGTGQYNHPNLLGFQESYFKVIDDLVAALKTPTIQGGVLGGQRTPTPIKRTGGSKLPIGNGATLTITLPANASGKLTIRGNSGGAWDSIWTGSFATTASRSTVGEDGKAFTTPGQLITSVTGSATDTTVAVATTATGSGSVLSWSADYFTF